MKSEVEASESTVMQKDDNSYTTDTIVEQAEDQHALLKNPKSMDKKKEDVSVDASEEVYSLPETTAEAIKAFLPETGIKLTAPSISSVDDTQYPHDHIRGEKGDMESTLPKEQEAEIMQTSLHECSSINMTDSIDRDSEAIDVEHEKNKINAEVSQIESMLLKSDIQETAEYGSDKMENKNFSKQIVSPIEEKSIEQPFYEESRDVGDTIAQVKAEDDSSMKTAEIQVQDKHIALTEDQEGKSPQALSYEKESDNEGMSLEDAKQISEKIPESRNVSCEDEEAEPTSEPQQSYQEVLEPSQIKCERGNDSKENANDNSTEREVTTSTEEMLVDSSSTIEATEKSSQAGLAAETGPTNRQENDEHQTYQTEVEENETISEMVEQNQRFPESELQETNVISTESISYDNANMASAALEEDNDKRDELKAEETGYGFIEENIETATREPYSSDQISNTDENSIPFSEKGDSAISTDSDKISSLHGNENMELIDTEAKLDKMQEVENKREIVVAETAFDDIIEEAIDESDMVSEKQVDSLTLERDKVTDEPGLIVDSRQNVPLPEEDQLKKLTDVRETAYVAEGEKNSIEEENESIRTPDKDTGKDSESNNEENQNDSKPGPARGIEPDIVKQLEIVNPDIEETKLHQAEQNQENSVHSDALGPEGNAQTTSTTLEPTSPENHEVKIDERMEETVFEIEQKNIENVELRSIGDVTSAEENFETHAAVGKLEDSTKSALGENNVTSEASINKSDDQNENQSLTVTCVQTETEAEDTINKTDNSEKEVGLQYAEETQSTRDATVESFQRAVTDEIEEHKNLENTNADPSQQHNETNTTNSNYSEESDEFHSEDESNTEEAKNQVNEEGSSSNTEGIRSTVEVSQSQDECSKVHEDSIHDIGVEETTDKQHGEQEDRSPYGEHDSVLADQVKAIDAGMDSQKENELSTNSSDGVLVQEDQTEGEACKYDEMDESDTRKDKELMSQEFEQDKLVNKITSQNSSPSIEPLEHNLGAVNPAMDDPTASKPSEIVNDEAITIEARKAAELEADQHNQTNEDPEQENDISADKINEGDSADELQHIRSSAIGYENSTTFAEADKHASADHLEVVDCKDDEHAENLQESESEIQGLATKDVDILIETNKDHNFDQSLRDLEHDDDAQNFENEGAQKLGQQVLLEAGSDVEEFQEMNTNLMELSENTETESDNIEVQDDGRHDEGGVCDDTAKTVLVTDPKIEGKISTGMPSHSGKLDQEINADNPVTNRDGDTGESSEAMQVVDIHEEVSSDCRVSPKEVVNQVILTDPGTDIQQENERNTGTLDCMQVQEDQRAHEFFKNSKMDESHTEKDIELSNQGFEQDSISSEMPCQKTSAAIEASRQDIGTAMDDHKQNEPSEIANDKAHIVEVSKEADFETEQYNQTNAKPEHENEISAEESMDVENREFIPESAELREENMTENEAINSRAADLGPNTVEELSGNENTNLEISPKVTTLDEDPRVNTEVIRQDINIENRKLVLPSAVLTEENNTENEAINSRGEDLGSNTIEDHTGYENTNSEIPQKKINSDEYPTVNTDIVPQNIVVENHKLIPESTELREENNTENEAINIRAADLGSNTAEDLSGHELTNSEMSHKVTNLDEDPSVNTEVMPQDMSIGNYGFISESTELREENNTENEAVNSIAKALGSNTVEDLSGNKNTNLEISQEEINLDEGPIVDTEVVLQDMSVENRVLVQESTDLTEENSTQSEAINSRAEDIISNTVEDSGNENRNLETSQKEISLNENSIVNTDVVLKDMDIENHELIPESTKLGEENSTENEAIKCRAVDLGSNTVEDLGGNKNTNSEISQKFTNLDEKNNTEVMPQVMDVENLEFIPESTDIRKENETESEAINNRGEDLGSNTIEDLTGNENTNLEISQREINLDEDPTVNTEIVPRDMDVENHKLIPESTELREGEESNTDDEVINSTAPDLGSNIIEDLSGNKNTNSELSQKLTNLDEDSRVATEVVPQDMSIENHGFIPKSIELREENNTENEDNSIAGVLGSNIVEDLGENKDTNLEISEKEINLDEDPIVDRKVVLQDIDVENHEIIPESTEWKKEGNIETEAINSRAADLGSTNVGDYSGKENTNLDISQKEISLNKDPIVVGEVVLQDMDVENHISIPSAELIKEKNTENEAINSKAEDLGPSTGENLGGNENINSEISQREIKLDEVPIVEVEMLQAMEKIQVDEEPENTERDCTQEGSQHTLAEERTIDQVKTIDTADAPQLENEEKTSMYDEQIQEVKETHEQCTSKREQNEQTPMHSEASGHVETEMPNHDSEECRIDVSEINNTEEVAEHDEHNNKALVDKINEQEVKCTNASSSRNEMATASSELTNDETLLLAEQMKEPPPAISQTNNADQGPELGQYIQELESIDAKKEENVSNVTNSSINDHDIDEMTADETVQTQGRQPVEPQENFVEPLSPTEATCTTQDKEDCSVTLQDLNKEKEADPTPNKETQRELHVSSGFELCGDLPYIPAVEDVSKTNEYLVPETQGAHNDPLDSEKMEPQSCTNSYSHETESEANQFQTIRASLTNDPSIRPISEKYEHMSKGVTENQEETKSPEQLIEPNNEEQTVEDIIEKRDHQALKSEMTVEESTVEESYESQETPTYNTIEEKKEISIETKPPEEVDNMGDDTQSSRVEELKDENAYEIRGCEGDTVTNEETVFHELGMRNSSHGNQGVDTKVDDENSVPIKDNYTRTSADEVMVAEEKHHGNTQSERTSITIDAATSEEKQVAAGSVKIVDTSSEPVLFKESKKVEDEIMEEKEETNADDESHEPEFCNIDNDADRDEKTLSNTECSTKSEECSITISKDSKEISKESNILVTSTSLEGEVVEKNFQQSTSGERTENEVRPMEPKIDAAEHINQMNVPKPDNMDVEKEKQQESAKGLECYSTLEPPQGNDRIWFTEMEVPEAVSSREIDSDHSEAKLKVDEIQGEGKFSHASDVHMDCQEEEKISAADIIATHICQEIETEDKLKQPSSEHQKQIPETSTLVTDANEKTFEEEVLPKESTENTFRSLDNPTESVCAPEEREIEHPSLEAEPNRDFEQKQDLKEKHRTMDNSVRTDPKELSSEFQGVETSAELKSDTEDSTLEILNLTEKMETGESSQFKLNSQSISGENPGNSCNISTDNHTKTESFEEVNGLKSEKLPISEEIRNDTQLQAVKNELKGESHSSNFEVHEAVATDPAGEEAMQDVNTIVSTEDRVLVQQSLPTTKSCDEAEKPLIADEHSANTTFSVSQVSGIDNTLPTETYASEEKVSEQPPMKKVSNQDSNITQTMLVDEEEQLQGNNDNIPQSSQLQDLCGKDSVNMRTDESVDTADVIYSGMNVEDFSKEGSESNTNEVPSHEPMQSLTTSKEDITAEKHNETEVKSMPQSTVGNKKEEEWVVVTQNPQDDEKRAADEPKTKKEKEDAGDDLGEEDSELKPMISEASRDIDLKTQNKKSHHILSGMGSKMKNSISKVKKAMACASPQFSPDDVIIKINKSKKS